MDRNTYLGSFAQENVVFQTTVVETSSYGDNFKRVMIFTEQSLISDASALLPVEGSETIKAATVTADTYASITTGILQSWLTDLFANGEVNEAYIVINGADALTAELQEAAYELLKAYAYWKTVCIGTAAGDDPADPSTLDATRFNTLAAALADLCLTDKQVLSGPVLSPFSDADPSGYATSPRFMALKDKFVFMSYHQDATRNAALYSVGLALSQVNSSGTPIGNSLDMTKSNSITTNGLRKTVRDALKAVFIQTWKPVGDNSSNVAAVGDKALNGDTIGASWIVAYVTYMTKVQVAILMTTTNFYKNAENYSKILNILMVNVKLFAGRLTNIVQTAPGYGDLPAAAADELVIPNAWQATYVDHVRKVTISGTLYIGE